MCWVNQELRLLELCNVYPNSTAMVEIVSLIKEQSTYIKLLERDNAEMIRLLESKGEVK